VIKSELRLSLDYLDSDFFFSSFFVLIASVLGESELSDRTPLGVLGV
jgi:hypothetical protein